VWSCVDPGQVPLYHKLISMICPGFRSCENTKSFVNAILGLSREPRRYLDAPLIKPR